MEKQKITIVVATTSEDKINGIKDAFSVYFPEGEFELKIYSSKTESNVSEQPFGNDTYQGAYNRIENIRKKYEESLENQGIRVDYYVSCEAGIDDTNTVIIKGVKKQIYSSEQIVCIYNPENDSCFFGKSSSWSLPEKDVKEIEKTNLDQYLRKRKCTGLQDVGNGRYITRKDAIKEATMAALASSLFIERDGPDRDL